MSIIQALLAIPSSTELGPFTLEYLVIGGGGGGGGDLAGGGGAGGYLNSTLTVSGSTNYTVTVGAGGAAGGDVRQSTTQNNTNGSPSVFASITASGGGKSGSYWVSSSAQTVGKDGGSGGGAGAGDSTSFAGGTGVVGQGTNGGTGGFSPRYGGGGGGGASSGGASAAGTVTGANGGNGTASNITGTSVTRAGGGGGGTYTAVSSSNSSGGAGGGGNGWGQSIAAGAGTANTGGGGGGGGYNASVGETAGAAGGAGVVILSYPDTVTISNPGGGLTYSTAANGSNTVATFTAGTGSIQFSGSAPPVATLVGHAQPMTGGTQWFSPGFFGVENTTQYQLANGTAYNTIYYRRVQTSLYRWWFLIVEDLGSNQYKEVYGAKIEVPGGGSTGDTITHTFSNAAVISSFGSLTIPSTGNFYIGWHSGVNGDSPPTGSIFADAATGGGVDYLSASSTTPSLNSTFTVDNINTGDKIHIAVQ